MDATITAGAEASVVVVVAICKIDLRHHEIYNSEEACDYICTHIKSNKTSDAYTIYMYMYMWFKSQSVCV